MKLFLSTAIMISFLSLVGVFIWWVWDQGETALKAVTTALIVIVALILCKLSWYGLR